MSVRTLGWVAMLSVLGWAGYTGVVVGSSYLEMSWLVERAVAEAAPKGKAARDAEAAGGHFQFVSEIRASLLAVSKRPGVAWTERELVVSETVDGLTVRVRWSQPIRSYDGRAVLALPLSVERSFSVTL